MEAEAEAKKVANAKARAEAEAKAEEVAKAKAEAEAEAKARGEWLGKCGVCCRTIGNTDALLPRANKQEKASTFHHWHT